MHTIHQKDPKTVQPSALLPQVEVLEQVKLVPLWTLADTHLERNFKFSDFRDAMAFVNRVANAADEREHHPDITISCNRVRLTLTTHKLGGLSRADFQLAERIDELTDEPKG